MTVLLDASLLCRLQAVADSTKRHVHVKVLSRVLYRTDLPGQYTEPVEGRKTHDAMLDKRGKAVLMICTVSSLATLRSRCFARCEIEVTQHIRPN